MNNKVIWLSILAVIVSFIGGFALANGLNRSELEKLRAENSRLQTPVPNTNQAESAEVNLSDEEIKQKIAEADQSPKDFAFQKQLGIGLYRYAAMKKNAGLMNEIVRILNRANQLNPKDYEVIVTLGNLYFDLGYYKKDNESFTKAREYYQLALAQKPEDVEIQNEVGLTYYLENPPDFDKAIAEFQKCLVKNPKHEKSLIFLTQSFLKQGKTEDAEKTLAQLKTINPKTPTIDEIKTQLSQENDSLRQ